MKFVFDDGGRKSAGYRGSTGDCVCRSVSIASGLPYQLVYDLLNRLSAGQRITKRQRQRGSARTGVYKRVTRKVMEELGFRWTPTMFIGQGCKVHLRPSELPMGSLVVSVSKHLVAVVDGVIHDTYDCSRDETRCVYGYWSKA